MEILTSALFALSGTIVAAIALREIFKTIDPAAVTDYRPCKGGWWEGELNGCALGLLKVPQQPINTYSNLAFLAGGFYLSFYVNTLSAYIFSLTLLYLCFGSALYHATSTKWGGSLDVSGIYAVFSSLTFYTITLHLKIDDSVTALLMFTIAVLAAYFLRYKYQGDMSIKVGIFLVITYGLAIWHIIKNNMSYLQWYLIISFVLFLLAYAVWIMDKKRVFPFKHLGHGFWHLFAATAISILFYGLYKMH